MRKNDSGYTVVELIIVIAGAAAAAAVIGTGIVIIHFISKFW